MRTFISLLPSAFTPLATRSDARPAAPVRVWQFLFSEWEMIYNLSLKHAHSFCPPYGN